MATVFDNQIQNRNFLSPIGFKFTLAKEPKVSFFSNSTIIPEIILGTAIQPSYLKDVDVPGDKLQYGDFSLSSGIKSNIWDVRKVLPMYEDSTRNARKYKILPLKCFKFIFI